MEVALFHRHTKKGKGLPIKAQKGLTAIVPPQQLLLEGNRRELLQKIAELTSLNPARFESVCLGLVHPFINHCQSLPETSNSYYAAPGGLLDHALNRTEAALSLLRDYIIPGEGGELSEEQKLWIYTLFSASLLQGIGKLHIDYRVELFDSHGQCLKQWCPLLESMASMGTHYSYTFEKEGDEEFRRRLNVLIARFLMPASGFAWIASDPQVLAVWLALINEDTRSAGTLGAILIRANGIAIQRYFHDFLARHTNNRGGRFNRITTFVDSVPDSLVEKEQLLGIEFINWLTKSLASGILVIDKAPLMAVPGGLLMSPELFQWYIRQFPEYKNWQAVQKAFLALKLHSLGADGGVTSRFEQTNTHQMLSGVVLADYAVALPHEVQLNHLPTGKISTISATELIHQAQFSHYFNRQESVASPSGMAHLLASGQWQTPEAGTHKPHSGFYSG